MCQVRGLWLKPTWSGKLSDSYITVEEGIVGVDGASNQAVNQLYSHFPEHGQAKI